MVNNCFAFVATPLIVSSTSSSTNSVPILRSHFVRAFPSSSYFQTANSALRVYSRPSFTQSQIVASSSASASSSSSRLPCHLAASSVPASSSAPISSSSSWFRLPLLELWSRLTTLIRSIPRAIRIFAVTCALLVVLATVPISWIGTATSGTTTASTAYAAPALVTKALATVLVSSTKSVAAYGGGSMSTLVTTAAATSTSTRGGGTALSSEAMVLGLVASGAGILVLKKIRSLQEEKRLDLIRKEVEEKDRLKKEEERQIRSEVKAQEGLMSDLRERMAQLNISESDTESEDEDESDDEIDNSKNVKDITNDTKGKKEDKPKFNFGPSRTGGAVLEPPGGKSNPAARRGGVIRRSSTNNNNDTVQGSGDVPKPRKLEDEVVPASKESIEFLEKMWRASNPDEGKGNSSSK